MKELLRESLLPRPRRVAIVPGTFRPRSERGLALSGASALLERLAAASFYIHPTTVAESDLQLELVSDLPPDGYRLRLNPVDGPGRYSSLQSGGFHGALNGVRTLWQLISIFKTEIPALEIEDWPAFLNRGVMLDVSRTRVPTMEELFRVVEQLASWKINHLQLYTEHTFAYPGHNAVWRYASPLTGEEIEEFDRYCQLIGVTLAANQNCFGHMERWLKHKRYAGLAETHSDWFWSGKALPGPFSLAPGDPGSIRLIDDLLKKLLPHFRSGLVNIGCDEALDVGQGRSKEEVERRGFPAVYSEFVNRVADLAKAHGFQPMFWADIALTYPESLRNFTSDLIALAWGYEGDSPFDEYCRRLKESGHEFWVCPGTSSWRSITGRTRERRQNVAAAVSAGMKEGANGFLMTDWGDEGHRQQWPISLIGMAEGAEASWSGEVSPPNAKASGKFAFDDPSGEAVEWLLRLGDADNSLRNIAGQSKSDGTHGPVRNATALYNVLHGKSIAYLDSKVMIDQWNEVLLRIRELRETLPPISSAQIREELELTAEVAEMAALAGLHREGVVVNLREIDRRMKGVITEHRRLWLARSRVGGLAESCGYYYKVRKQLRTGA